jgi:hypothetical protein
MYIKRDSSNNIVALSLEPGPGYGEYVSDTAPELLSFMNNNIPAYQLANAELSHSKQLQHTDAELARVLEDLIELLSAKGIMSFTDLPIAAQNKLLQRKNFRQNLRSLNLITDEDDTALP